MSTRRSAQRQRRSGARRTQSTDLKRRRFLLALGAGGAGAAAVATNVLHARWRRRKSRATPVTMPQGYRETEHVRDYYATTRI